MNSKVKFDRLDMNP